jgi:hypothetical protein
MSQIHSNPDIAVEIFVLEPGRPLMDQHELDLAGSASPAAPAAA